MVTGNRLELNESCGVDCFTLNNNTGSTIAVVTTDAGCTLHAFLFSPYPDNLIFLSPSLYPPLDAVLISMAMSTLHQVRLSCLQQAY